MTSNGTVIPGAIPSPRASSSGSRSNVIRAARVDQLSPVGRMYEWLFAPPSAPPPDWGYPIAEHRRSAELSHHMRHRF
ncbi:MAG: hypothetical protein ACLPZR_30980 [Solirubrobacteraceae bacterium]